MNFLLLPLLLTIQSTDLKVQADELFANEQWDTLIPVLDELLDVETSAELLYDKGVALYELGDYAEAIHAFDEAMNLASDDSLRAYSAYNYGNALFQETMRGLEGTGEVSEEAIQAIDDAKDHIVQSINHYREAISQNPNDGDARANGEIAWHLLNQLKQMQEQMEQEQERQQQQEEANNQEQEQEEQDSSGEQQEQQDGQDSEQQDNQDGEQGEQQNQSNQDGEQQESQSDQPEQSSEDQNQSNEQQESSDESESDQSQTNDGESESNDQEDDAQQDGSESEQEQQQQDGELKTAEPQEDLDGNQEQSGEVKETGNRLSKDETNRLLQLIRDKEKERRQAIAARKAKNRKPVPKDW